MKYITLLALAMNLTACGFEVVDEGYRGIKSTFGKVHPEPLNPGLHFYNPLTSGIFEFEVREQKWAETSVAFTKDTQKATMEFAVTYYPEPSKVSKIYSEVGRLKELQEKILKPSVLGSMKDAIGSVIADDLVASREVITKQALERVREDLSDKSVIVTDLVFTNIDFDAAYEQAVEEKVVATQRALKAKNDTVRIMEEAKQTVESAKAEAESMKIKSQALSQNKGLIAFEWVQKWDGKQPQIVMGGSSIPMLDMGKLIKAD